MRDVIRSTGGPGSSGYARLCKALKEFECKLDLDVQHFLNNKAIESNERGIAYTHLIFDEDRYLNGETVIEGYFTLTTKTVDFGDAVSNSTIKKLCGGYKKDSKPFVLVAQLGKHIGDTRVSEIHLLDIFDYIYEYVYKLDRIIPVKFLLIECSKEMLDTGLYQGLGFSVIGHVTRAGKSNTEELYQMVLEIPEQDYEQSD